MPIRSHHARRKSRSGTPMRRFADFEAGDTFRYKRREYLKSADGKGHPTDTSDLSAQAVVLPASRWVCEF